MMLNLILYIKAVLSVPMDIIFKLLLIKSINVFQESIMIEDALYLL